MKLGSFSVILSSDEYLKNNIQPPNITKKDNYLYKVTHIKKTHNGEKLYVDFLNKKNDYVVQICKDTISNIKKDDKLLEYIKENIKKCEDYDINEIFKNNNLVDYKLVGYFVENGGKIDLFDSLTDLVNLQHNIWSIYTINRLNEFAFQMCKCLEYLQSNKMGHFDIKPENIVYNYNNKIPFGKRFKLIDFGFADKYPFSKYTSKIYGSHDYVPIYFQKNKYPPWKINNKPNDWFYNPVQKKYLHYISYHYIPDIIYKSDVYSMGIVFNQLIYYIEDHLFKLNIPSINLNHIKNLIDQMTHQDIILRNFAKNCINYLDNELDENRNIQDSNSCLCFKKCLKN